MPSWSRAEAVKPGGEQQRLADIAAGRGDWQRWGTIPAYEWDFNAINPSVLALAHGFYFDVIRHDNERVPLKIYSMVGLVPLFAAAVIEASTLRKLPVVTQTVGNVLNCRWFLKSILPAFVEPGEDGTPLLAVVDRTRLAAILQRVLDAAQFLLEYGVGSLSRQHAAHPYSFEANQEGKVA